MKAFFAVLLLTLSISTFSAETNVECLDAQGNVVNSSITHLKSVMANFKGDRTQVYVTGTITEIKKEDHSGLAHQKYNIKIDKDITFLIVSNLSFGRVPLTLGKFVSVCGEFKRVGKGMVHWTHFDPRGTHPDGFTIVDGQLYGDTEVEDFNNVN